MMGAVVKRHFAAKLGIKPEEMCLVSFMPCTAKKHEAEREEQHRPGETQDVDFVLTTREFGHLLRTKNIPLASLPETTFDSPLGASTGAAVIFGATGGVMEAALRTAYEIASGQSLPKLEVDETRGLRGVKEAVVKLPENAAEGVAGKEIRVAVASGIGNARHLLQAMAEGSAPKYDFIEVMSCPGGCIGGGGQPKTRDPQAVLKRMGAIYSLDQKSVLRKSHENPEVQKLYEEFLKKPGGELSHELLHTKYTDRSHETFPSYSVAERKADQTQRTVGVHSGGGGGSSGGGSAVK
jgi:NADH-quinone oxidoreductase subunit G